MLNRVLLSLAALSLPLLLPRPALGQSVADTKWIVDGSAETNGGLTTVTFKADSTVVIANDWEDDGGTWKQVGDTVTFEYGPITMGKRDILVRIEVTRNGEQLTGTWALASGKGDSHAWSARLRT